VRKTKATTQERPAKADPQKEDVYEWEDEWRAWSRNTHTLPELRAAIRTACAYYGVRHPKVKQHNLRSLSWSIAEYDLISLQAVGPLDRGGKNMATAMHEAAHHIVYKLCGHRPADHGPTFLGVYLWLLAAAGVAPESALFASARAHGLKWRHAPPTVFSCRN
jgi:hypothetical protein